ncbi:MAG: PadR family transcriptional regulator [Proteobacteria bacterium]|jgi:DNA-binding PadR family transcriptional regulator|nr:PadR family transcriptional regulator [Pseudomonadota bacterium]MBK9253565.1 PadR family transcriptional regulator [Pseudomonadota bacterium]
MRPHFNFHGRHEGAGGHGGRGGHGGHGRHGGRGGGGGGPGSRVFHHGALRLVVLALIAEAPRHGYEIIKAIEERLAGSYSPSPGVIYPTLTLLQEIGHVTVEENEGKKRYSITDEGRAHLAANQPAVDAAMARMQAINANHGGGPAPQIIRAMENLKLALRLRVGRGPLSADELQAVAAAIDSAALAIERT